MSNVFWSWIGVAFQILPGLVVTPFIIFKLGEQRYGVWVIASALTGNYALLDLGFRSAAVRYSAQYRALGQAHKLDELMSTMLLYFSAVAALLVAITLGIWRDAHRLFTIAEPLRGDFAWLVLLSGLSAAAGTIGGAFSGCVEGFQRFDIVNRIFIVSFGARSLGYIAALTMGYGLIAMGTWSLACNLLLVGLFAMSLFRIAERLKLSPAAASRGMFRQIWAYGVHTFLSSLGARSLEQAAPLLIGHFRSEAEAGYYAFPLRILQYGTDAVSRIGIVATPKAAGLAATGQKERVHELAVFGNRYSLALFLPVAVFLHVYGSELFGVWLRKPMFALHSAPLLAPLLVGAVLALAAQSCSASLLFGLGAHRAYAYTLLVELACTAVAAALVLPKFGIMGVAVVSATCMSVSRGAVTPLVLTRHLGLRYGPFMASVLVRPLLTAAPIWAAAMYLRHAGMAPHRAVQLAAAGLVITAVYLSAACFTCLAPQHRAALVDWTRAALRIGRAR